MGRVNVRRPRRGGERGVGRAMVEALEGRRLLTTIYVDASSVGGGVHDGSSWRNAFFDLHQALAAANPGDQIRVAEGTYATTSTTNRSVSFELKNGVGVYGGYAGFGAPDPDARDVAGTPTVLSGEIGSAAAEDNSFHVLRAGAGVSAATVLDGLVITDGYASGGSVADGWGGGLTIVGGSPAVNNCTFLQNTGGFGGGVYVQAGSPRFTGCRFVANTGLVAGGGIYSETGAAPAVSGCTFLANTAAAAGGAFCSNDGSPALVNSVFAGNTASGAGIQAGGAVFVGPGNATVVNCTFNANGAATGGGIYSNGALTVANTVLWGNTATGGGAQLAGATGSTAVSHSVVQGGFAGTGNLDADPKFIRAANPGPDGLWNSFPDDDDGGDLRLGGGSPALNAGNNAAIPAGVTTDRAGAPRVAAGVVDIGAFEGAAAPGPVLYVDARATAGNHTGNSWADGFVSLQTAIAAASPGQSIRVAGGTYRPGRLVTNPAQTFLVKNGVSMFGRYAGLGAAGPDARTGAPSVLSHIGQQVWHMVTVPAGVGPETVIDGFVIRGGQGQSRDGGGMRIENASPTVRNVTFLGNSARNGGGVFMTGSAAVFEDCTFYANSAQQGGAGLYADATSAPAITRCTFSDNTATGNGGGLHLLAAVTVADCTFTGNVAGTGGGAYVTAASPTFLRGTFTDNRATGSGGGIAIDGASPGVLASRFESNTAGSSGGGVYVVGANASPTIDRCTFEGHWVDSFSGNGSAINASGASSPIVARCTFTGNGRAAFYGWVSSPTLIACTFNGNGYGAAFDNATAAAVTNCTFAGNTAAGVMALNGAVTLTNCTFAEHTSSVGAIQPQLTPSITLVNCVVWNAAPGFPLVSTQHTGTVVASFSLIRGGYPGTGNFNADPLFMRRPDAGPDTVWGTPDDDFGDLRPSAGSPLVDAGHNAALPAGTFTDVAGNPRFTDVPGRNDPGAIVDIGAYERTTAIAAVGGAYLYNLPRPALRVTFGGDLAAASVQPHDIATLTNLTTGQRFTPVAAIASAAYDAATRSGTWNLRTLLPDGNYRATLAGGAVTDLFGNTAAAPYSFDFFVLAGDANRDRVVDFNDLVTLAQNYNTTGKAFAEGDFNYDGDVDFEDLVLLAQRYGTSLPPPAAAISRTTAAAGPDDVVDRGLNRPVFRTVPAPQLAAPPAVAKPRARAVN